VPVVDEDQDEIPDYVSSVAEIYEEVLDFYLSLGFRAPLKDENLEGNGGDGRYDVYLLDFAHQSDGAFSVEACMLDKPEQCMGYMVQENDFSGYNYPNLEIATRILASHEFFHAIQAAYDNDQGVVYSEGGAVWASDIFDPELGDLSGFTRGYLGEPTRTLDVPPPGPVPSFAYGASIFFRFLEERYDRDLLRLLIESTEDGAGRSGGEDSPADPYWLEQLELLLVAEYESSFAEAFSDFSVWNFSTKDHADPERSYLHGAEYAAVKAERQSLPYEEDRLRLYPAAAQFYAFQPTGRESLSLALKPDEREPEESFENLRAFVALGEQREPWSQILELELDGSSVVESPESIGLLLLVNTARAGNSKRPGICFGSPEEVVECRGLEEPDAAILPDATLSEDATPPDEEDVEIFNPSEDASLKNDAEISEPEDDGGDEGCSQSHQGGLPWIFLLPLLLLRFRARAS